MRSTEAAMRRILTLTVLLMGVGVFTAQADPGSGSGPIAVDSTTFVPGSSVMGTDGGVYGDSIPPVSSTTTAAIRMTAYRAMHVNLRDSSGNALGTSGNPLFTTAGSSVTIGTITVTNSSFSVTGSSVTTFQPTASSLNATVFQPTASNLNVTDSINPSSNTVKAQQSGVWMIGTTPTGTSTVTFNGAAQPVTVSGTPNVAVASALPAGTNNLGTVSGSSVTVFATQGGSLPTSVVNTVGTTLSAAIPTGTNNIGTVSGSTITIIPPQGGSLNTTVTGALPAGSNAIGTVTDTQANASSLKASVFINGSSNTVVATQPTGSNLHVVVDNTIATSGVVNIVSTNTLGVSPATGQAFPIISTGTLSVSGIVTATQAVNSNLRASVDIDGSSNTVIVGAGSANIGKIVFQTPTTSELTSAVINASAAGDNVIISTQSAQTVRVFRMLVVFNTSTIITFKDGGGTALTGPISIVAGGSIVLDFSGDPWFVTGSGHAFIINQTGTAQMSGKVDYTQS